MALIEDFKKFAFKGNVVDLAVGVIIGAAFGKIVSGLVGNVIMPLVSLVLPSGDWRNASLILRHMSDPKDDVMLKYGALLGDTVDFLVVAFVLFLVVSKLLAAKKAPEPAPAPEKKPEERMLDLLADIRDGLRAAH